MVNLAERGSKIRGMIRNAQIPADLEEEIRVAYREMEKRYGEGVDVAVRSSATAEDLPTASFAGQQDTYLKCKGRRRTGEKRLWTVLLLYSPIGQYPTVWMKDLTTSASISRRECRRWFALIWHARRYVFIRY